MGMTTANVCVRIGSWQEVKWLFLTLIRLCCQSHLLFVVQHIKYCDHLWDELDVICETDWLSCQSTCLSVFPVVIQMQKWSTLARGSSSASPLPSSCWSSPGCGCTSSFSAASECSLCVIYRLVLLMVTSRCVITYLPTFTSYHYG